ncbi:hypothetical protein FSP39_014227 [Pinctada imbricata]|uniref:Mitochondria-eating protein n=1 Tax=Pinctada imbricata TaxID=66713 RepID=A0AA88Y8X1_PINIB|nr:hypothetical protein FSP39_014227 [Pinctada imbricata]
MKLECITHVSGPVDYSNCPTEDSDDASSVPIGNMIDPEVDYLHVTIERDNLKQENDSLKQENDFLKQSIQAQEQKLKSVSEQLDRQIRNNQKLSEEKENALTRLSEVAGSKLKYNNPGITDLSDDNRPNKLSEKFSELYDNEWTEAFEALEGDKMEEEEVIRRLLGILQFVYEECSIRTTEQRKQMFGLVQRVGIPITTGDKKASEATVSKVNIHVSKKISDLQKDTASDIIPKIKQELQTSMVPELLPVVSKCDSYFKKCVTLCWMMRVQEPPVVLSFDCEKGKTVNADLYRHYTRTGTKIDFMVWPAMILYEGGPLLSKGVFQPLLEV